MPLASNPETGEVVSLDDKGQWQKAQTAVNPQTNELLALDGKEWKPVPQSKGTLGYIDDAMRSIASGITFGWADEFAAKMNELTGRGSYDENVQKERARDASIPLAIKLPGEVAGAIGATYLVAPTAAWKAIAEASGRLPAWMRFAALGATEGGIAGAGGATEGNRTSGALTGAAAGGAVGAATPAITNVVSKGASAVRNAVMPQTGAVADIGRAVVRDEMVPGELAARAAALQAERPGVATIADAAGENVKGLVERVAQTPGAGRTQVIPALTERQQGQLQRISNDLAGLTGTARTATQAAEQVIGERATAATPLYQTAYEAGDRAVWSPTLERLSASPTVQNAMRGAVKAWQDNAIADGFGAMNPGAMVQNGGRLTFNNTSVPVFPNLQFWDYTKRIIDDQVGAALRSGENQKARTLTRLTQVLRRELDTIVPEYTAARDAWAGPSAYLNAIEEGRNILSRSVSAEEFASTFRALSRSEQEAYRVGAVSSIVSKLGNDAARLPDLTKYLRSPEARGKITAMMPTPEAAQAWQRRLGFEVNSSEMVGRALGNSATARRLAEMEDAKGVVGDLVMDALTGSASSVGFLRRVFTAGPRWLRDTLRSRTDREIADILTNPDRVGDIGRIINRASRTASPTSGIAPAALTASGVAVTQ